MTEAKMGKTIDARGLSCPQPAILANQAIKSGQFPLEVIVDAVSARENVQRAAMNAGCKVTVKETGDEFTLIINK
jgi:tRNA 2-thiouridine synthesizing protein A